MEMDALSAWGHPFEIFSWWELRLAAALYHPEWRRRPRATCLFTRINAMKQIFLAVAALVVVALPAQAQRQRSSVFADMATKEFVEKATISNMFEIEAAQLAERKVTNPAYRDFAKMIITDRTKAGNELKLHVKNMNGLQIPSKLDQEHRQMIQVLRSEMGANFEDQYRTSQIHDHQETIELFQDYAQNGGNFELMMWAKNTVPTFQAHRQNAEALPMPSVPVIGGARDAPATTGSAPADHR
jgi:predicted outer membrane protein